MSFTWEDAVRQLREDPTAKGLIKACYFDDPLVDAAERFYNSEEWQATKKYFPIIEIGKALDLGAGRGISSYALAKDGWTVIAIEPDPSDLVGAGAIRTLAKECQYNIQIVQDYGETLPFPENHFDLIYGRQVLHHAKDLEQVCHEAYRVLKPGGRFVATREHVVNNKERDLEEFLTKHPLHHLYGGENAFTLQEYKDALLQAGFRPYSIIPPYSNVINYSVETRAEHEERYKHQLDKILSAYLVDRLWNRQSIRGAIVYLINKTLDRFSRIPGRAYSFIFVKSV